MKPSLTFLRKVADGKVYAWFMYSAKHGGSYGFTGGEATYTKHRKAGYVGYAPPASFGRRGVVELTPAGRLALEQAEVVD